MQGHPVEIDRTIFILLKRAGKSHKNKTKPGKAVASSRPKKAAPQIQKVGVVPPRPKLLSGLMAALGPPTNSTADDAQRSSQSKVEVTVILAVILVLFVPFVGSAFRIDDPLFLWTARHIQNDPANPYGFSVNWYGRLKSISAVAKNPPLACYYTALAASLVGWSETALHLAFIVPALGVGMGTILLARRLCRSPLLATLLAVLTPVFLVSGITVMSDMMMLAFWVFAVYFWIIGLESGKQLRLALAATLIAASALSKYFGMTLIPLLLVYSIFKQRRFGWWLVYFLIPIAVLAWYQWVTQRLYGRGLLLDAAAYATGVKSQFGRISVAKTLVSLVFTGGCVATALFFARQLWSKRALALGAVFAAVVTSILLAFNSLGTFPMPADKVSRALLAAQVGIWGTIGISIIVLTVLDFWMERDAESLLLFLWIAGTFVFAGFVNWTTNGRSILPIIAPAGILMARRLDSKAGRVHYHTKAMILPLIAATILSLAVAWADCRFANTGRIGAKIVHEKYSKARVSFQGHWGFQYYMEQLGMTAVDFNHPELIAGDIVVVPPNNTNILPMPPKWSTVRETIMVPSSKWLATMDKHVGGGFYADVLGPLPFAIGSIRPEQFVIYDVF
jgi:4-amino-4-deoxy-L-arabinose transferase-like glycosyltransferase